MIDQFKNIQTVQWNGETNIYFTHGEVYRVCRVEGDDLVVFDNSDSENYIEGSDLQYVSASTKKAISPMAQLNKAVSREPEINIELGDVEYPKWANFLVINASGTTAYMYHPKEERGLNQLIELSSDIIIKLPNSGKTFEMLADLYKEGKISVEEFKDEMSRL